MRLTLGFRSSSVRSLAVGACLALLWSTLTPVPALAVAGFGDVGHDRFYAQSVQWMVDNGITTGTSETCFSPEDPVTRGQLAAFMHRMEGSPEVATPHGFVDLDREWQQAPVRWMKAVGITTGTSATTYSPNDRLTRGQLAAALHRLAGEPAAAGHPFVDVVSSWQQVPVAWMVANEITTGTSATTFSPDDTVTRGQLATFFHRYKGSPSVTVDRLHPDDGACTRPVAPPPDAWAPVTGVGAASVTDSLEGLGVPLEQTDRVDENGEALPAGFSPLGSSPGFGSATTAAPLPAVQDEIAVVDFGDDSDSGPLKVLDLHEADATHTASPSDHPWTATDTGADEDQRTLRDATAGDLDGDGLEEVVAAWIDSGGATDVLRVTVEEDRLAGYGATTFGLSLTPTGVVDVAVAVGDVAAGGGHELIIGLVDATTVRVLVVAATSSNGRVTGFATPDTAATVALDADTTFDTVELAVGSVDHDVREEVAFVVNEFAPGPLTGTARGFVVDDGDAGFVSLFAGPVEGMVGASTFGAQIADVTIGDFDGDTLGEVAFGGLTTLGLQCFDFGGGATHDSLVVVLDDSLASFGQLAATVDEFSYDNCPAFDAWRFRFVHTNAVDLDADGIDSLQVSQRVLALSGSSLVEEFSIPDLTVLDPGSDAGSYLRSTSVSFSIGDVTNDGREDILVRTEWGDDIHVFGQSQIDAVGFAELTTISVPSADEDIEPMVIPVNLDRDSLVVSFSEGSHALVFSEPIPVAALAAAPCLPGVGQNLDACSTSFGQAQSSGVERSESVSVSASVHVGVTVGGGPAELEQTLGQGVTFTASRSNSYEVTTSRTFSAGSLEDAVVFTSIPYDQYTYTILSHPDPDRVGGTMTVSVPREPVMTKVERRYYNENIVAGSQRIDDRVFRHVPGDVDSYPTRGEKNQLLALHPGFQSELSLVGQGSGSEEVAIEVGTSVGQTNGTAWEYSYELEVTAGAAIAGFSVGGSEESSVTITSGESTTYSASVGNLPAETFAANAYGFGMFTYAQPLDGQQIEVINFWVQP